jgi:hypothetical protein
VFAGAVATVSSMELTARSGRADRVRAAEARIRWLALLSDDLVRIPGTDRRFGIKPVLGLIPGIGDVAGAAPGVLLLLEAVRFRLPTVVLARMVVNVAVDFVIGLIPVLGDLFDFGFKANMRNVELFRRHATDPGASTIEHTRFLAGLLLVAVGGVLLAGWLLVQLLVWLDRIVIPVP